MFYFHGIPVSAEEFIKRLFNTITLPEILKSEEELRELWSSPITRNELLKKLEDNGVLFSTLGPNNLNSVLEKYIWQDKNHLFVKDL